MKTSQTAQVEVSAGLSDEYVNEVSSHVYSVKRSEHMYGVHACVCIGNNNNSALRSAQYQSKRNVYPSVSIPLVFLCVSVWVRLCECCLCKSTSSLVHCLLLFSSSIIIFVEFWCKLWHWRAKTLLNDKRPNSPFNHAICIGREVVEMKTKAKREQIMWWQKDTIQMHEHPLKTQNILYYFTAVLYIRKRQILTHIHTRRHTRYDTKLKTFIQYMNYKLQQSYQHTHRTDGAYYVRRAGLEERQPHHCYT